VAVKAVKPVTVETMVPVPVERVYAHLAVLANHAAFLDHFLVNWSFTGPSQGVGAKGRARANTAGSQDWTEFEILAAEEPRRLVEDGLGNGGKRHTRGTYELEPLADGGTRISFRLEWLEASRAERLCPPLTRAFVRRPNAKALRRLAGQLGD
jgi:uncharacterized protein YndB with AHSA1/START domain